MVLRELKVNVRSSAVVATATATDQKCTNFLLLTYYNLNAIMKWNGANGAREKKKQKLSTENVDPTRIIVIYFRNVKRMRSAKIHTTATTLTCDAVYAWRAQNVTWSSGHFFSFFLFSLFTPHANGQLTHLQSGIHRSANVHHFKGKRKKKCIRKEWEIENCVLKVPENCREFHLKLTDRTKT